MPTKKAEPDLLADLSDDMKRDGAPADLLAEITEDNDADAWMPKDADEGVQGTVVKRSLTKSDFTSDPIPVVVIDTADGKRLRVTGFQSVLRREIEDADPQVGDLFAVKYFGVKENKKGTGKYHHFKVGVRRGAGQPVITGASSKPPF